MFQKLYSSKLVRKISLSFAMKIAGVLFLLGFNLLIAKVYGAKISGIYYLTLNLVTIAFTLSTVGLKNTVLRFASSSYASNDFGSLYSLLKKSLFVTSSIAVLLQFGIYFNADFIAEEIFSKPEITYYIKLFSFSITPLAIISLLSEYFKATSQIKISLVIKDFGVPLFSFFLLLLSHIYFNEKAIFYSRNIAAFVVLGVGFFYLIRFHKRVETKVFQWKRIVFTAYPLFIIVIMQLINQWSDAFIIGIYDDLENVGIYSIAKRLAGINLFIIFAVNTVVTAKFSVFFDQKDFSSLRKLVKKSSLLLTISSLPIVIVMLIFPTEILSMFGEEFKEGTLVLRILVIGQFYNVIVGSVGYLLMMSGNEKILRNIVFVSAFTSISTSLILIPKLGIIGAAIAGLLVKLINNTLSLIYVKKKLGFIPLFSYQEFKRLF